MCVPQLSQKRSAKACFSNLNLKACPSVACSCFSPFSREALNSLLMASDCVPNQHSVFVSLLVAKQSVGVQAHSMEQVVSQAGRSSTGSSDRAATAAWRLFEPMQFGMGSHPQVPPPAAHDLAEDIAAATCGMSDSAEMAILWTEVCYSPQIDHALLLNQRRSPSWFHVTTLMHCWSRNRGDSTGSSSGNLCLGGALMLLACLRVLRMYPAASHPQECCNKYTVARTLLTEHRLEQAQNSTQPSRCHLVGVQHIFSLSWCHAPQPSGLYNKQERGTHCTKSHESRGKVSSMLVALVQA